MSRNTRRNVALHFGKGQTQSATVLGGKGAGLAVMRELGLPVPPGFTVSTTVARGYRETRRLPKRFASQLERELSVLERETGKRFGDVRNPLLVSVRSGAAVSMPGMMDTVLNLGLNPDTVAGLAEVSGERFALDSYRRFLGQFGEVVLGIPRRPFEEELRRVKRERGVFEDSALDADGLREVIRGYRRAIQVLTAPIDDPMQQLEAAVVAVIRSWDSARAIAYRAAHHIPDWWGTAVNVQAMVFGNRGDDSCTGVVFSRNVATGEEGLYGEFLPNAQGEDVVAGIRTPMPIGAMRDWNSRVYAELEEYVNRLDRHHNDVVDVEFTVECGRLFILQCRAAKRTPLAAVRIATHFAWEKRWTKEEALARVTEEQLASVCRPSFEDEDLREATATRLLGKGLPASSGAAVGKVALTKEAAVRIAARGESVILVRPDTSPDDLEGMLAAAAIVTETGGATSHAAVVARGLGKPAVVGANKIDVREGEMISVDGNAGVVVRGSVKLASQANAKEVNIFLHWARGDFLKKHPPRLRLDRVNEGHNMNVLLNSFYLADAMEVAARGTALRRDAAALKEQVHVEAAELIATYLALAVSGELRHVTPSGGTSHSRTAIDTLCKRFEVRLGGEGDLARHATISILKRSSVAEQVEFFRLAETVFAEGHWISSYGGSAWATIARAPAAFLAGTLPHSVFADHAFDLQHNTGSVFGKGNFFTGDRLSIRHQLNAKKHGRAITELREQLVYYAGFSASVAEFWARGERLGIWQKASQRKEVSF